MSNNTTEEAWWNSTATPGDNDELRDKILNVQSVTDKLMIFLGVPIMAIGTVGHILTLVVLILSARPSRGSSLVSNASGVYLIALSCASFIPLYSGLLRYVILGLSNWAFDVRDVNVHLCRSGAALSYFSLQYFAWLQATIATDRLVAVMRPYKYKELCTRRNGTIIITILLVVLLVINVSIFSQIKYEDFIKKGCNLPSNPPLSKAWPYVDLTLFSLAPGAILIVCHVLIILNLKKNSNPAANHDKQRSVSRMLIALNVIFVIATLPISIIAFVPWGGPGSLRYFKVEQAFIVCLMLQYAGTAITFVVYCLTGSKFRQELKVICSSRCTKKKKAAGSEQFDIEPLNERMSILRSNKISYTTNTICHSKLSLSKIIFGRLGKYMLRSCPTMLNIRLWRASHISLEDHILGRCCVSFTLVTGSLRMWLWYRHNLYWPGQSTLR